MNETNKFTYFKLTFLAVSAGLTTALIIIRLFDIDFKDFTAVSNMVFKSLIVGLLVGMVLGLLNIYLKIGPFNKTM